MPKFIEFHAEKDRILALLMFYRAKTLLKILPLLTANITASFLLSLLRGKAHIRLKSYLWLIANAGRIRAARKKLQEKRKAPDKEIMNYMTYKSPYAKGAAAGAFLKALKTYCKVMRIPVKEARN